MYLQNISNTAHIHKQEHPKSRINLQESLKSVKLVQSTRNSLSYCTVLYITQSCLWLNPSVLCLC
jgi:hypothetical protein